MDHELRNLVKPKKMSRPRFCFRNHEIKLPVASYGVSDLKQKMSILNRNPNPNPNRTYAKGSIDFDPDLDFDLLYFSALKQRVTPQQAAGNSA